MRRYQLIVKGSKCRFKYGEVLLLLQSLLILERFGRSYDITFILPPNNHRNAKLLSMDLASRNCMHDITKLVKLVGLKTCNAKIISDELFGMTQYYKAADNRWLGTSTMRLSSWKQNQELLVYLMEMGINRYGKQSMCELLVGNRIRKYYGIDKNVIIARCSTTYRYNEARPDKNTDIDSILWTASHCEKTTGVKTVVLTSAAGIQFLRNNHPNVFKLRYLEILQSAGNFTSQLREQSMSRIHWQVGGGGLAVTRLFSSLPYVISQPLGYMKKLILWKDTQLFSESMSNRNVIHNIGLISTKSERQ